MIKELLQPMWWAFVRSRGPPGGSQGSTAPQFGKHWWNQWKLLDIPVLFDRSIYLRRLSEDKGGKNFFVEDPQDYDKLIVKFVYLICVLTEPASMQDSWRVYI